MVTQTYLKPTYLNRPCVAGAFLQTSLRFFLAALGRSRRLVVGPLICCKTLEYQMVTKTYLQPTYLPTYVTTVTVGTAVDSSDSNESSDSSDQKTFFSLTKHLFSHKQKKNFFKKNYFHKKKKFTKKTLFHNNNKFHNKYKMWQNSKTQNLTKVKSSKCDKKQKQQMWQNSVCDKT